MNRNILKYFAEIGSVVSVNAVAIAAIIAYFSFEAIGLSFFRVASIEDTFLIGIGLLAVSLPVLLVLVPAYVILKFTLGLVYAFAEKSEIDWRSEGRNRAIRAHLSSVVFYAIVYLIISYCAARYSYTSAIFLICIWLAAGVLSLAFFLLTNFFIRRNLVTFRDDSPYYFIQVPRERLTSESRILRDNFRLRVFRHLAPIAAFSFVFVVYFSIVRPLQSDSYLDGDAGGVIDPACAESPVLWSGTRSVVYKCNDQLHILQGAQNIVVVSRSEGTLKDNLEDFVYSLNILFE